MLNSEYCTLPGLNDGHCTFGELQPGESFIAVEEIWDEFNNEKIGSLSICRKLEPSKGTESADSNAVGPRGVLYKYRNENPVLRLRI